MNAWDLIDEFQGLEARIAAEKGDFVFFALFMREELPNRWDLMIGAPWAYADRKAAVDYVIDQIKSQMGSQALVYLSRIVVIDPHAPAVQAVNRRFPVEHGSLEVADRDFFGLTIKHAYIVTSKQPPAPAVA